MKTHAMRAYEFGGPEVMQWEEVDLPDPAAGEIQVRHTAIGLNFIDVYHRTGLYPIDLPSGMGSEAAGIVDAVGDGVDDFSVGDRVVYTGRPNDAYSLARNFKASESVHVPDDISDEVAAATLLKGLTAWYLLRRSHRVQPGDPILLYAAAGGVGSIASQWAKHLGATVIGIVSTDAKADLAMSQGCDFIIKSADEDVPGAVMDMTGGKGVAAVYDSVGKDTFMQSLDCLRPHGTMVTFGNASGAVEPFAPAELAKRGSLYVTRPILGHFVSTREDLLHACDELFGFIRDAKPVINIGQRYALTDAVQAHRDLEARKTTGSTILVP